MSTVAELRAKRRQTSAFIAAQPTTIALIPVSKAKTASGGVVTAQVTPRAEQTLRLIDQSTAGGNLPGILRAGDGQQRKITHQLLGAYDAVMAVGDFWMDGNARLEILELLPFNGYERRAMVTRYG